MPNTREKLIEFMANLDCNAEYCKDCEFGNDIDGCVRRQKEIIADRLIAHGVTVQKWIPVTERLPKPLTQVLSYSGHELFDVNMVDGGVWDSEYYSEYSVTHWMPLPEPPKGE